MPERWGAGRVEGQKEPKQNLKPEKWMLFQAAAEMLASEAGLLY